MTRFETKLLDYMDAAFPILYLHTFEEGKAKESIRHTVANVPHIQVLEWDGTDRVCDLLTGAMKYDLSMYSLADILDDRLSCTGRQILILENLDTFMDDPAVMARIKKIAEQINSGILDTTLFIISPTLRIPPELEKYITVLEMAYLSVEEIRGIIRNFCEDQHIQVSEALEKEFATAFKGLSEFEIQHILQLAYSQRGELTRGDTSLIFDQKRQMIQKAGICSLEHQ